MFRAFFRYTQGFVRLSGGFYQPGFGCLWFLHTVFKKTVKEVTHRKSTQQRSKPIFTYIFFERPQSGSQAWRPWNRPGFQRPEQPSVSQEVELLSLCAKKRRDVKGNGKLKKFRKSKRNCHELVWCGRAQ